MKKVKRKNGSSIVETMTQAQRFAFAPIAFQALCSMLDLGIIEYLDKKPSFEKDIILSLNLDEYTVRTLLQVGVLNNLVKEKDGIYSLTKMGELFLYDDMTRANFDYVKDVCYLGASELSTSFKEQRPAGLQKFVGDYPTIYPALTLLPDKMQKSWYHFDHYYSDNCFEEVFKIITDKYNSIFDIGGNTGKFETVCLKNDIDINITMLDLEININKIKNKTNLKNCNFHPINVLDETPKYPKIENSAVFMSQFLDCFSKKDIRKILTDIKKNMDNYSSIYILEPYTDKQKFEGAEYALTHTSLYFTCMANGVSKFYTFEEMKKIIEDSGLKINQCYNDIGSYNYTLLECKKDEMVSA